jgi:hypothetical protein
MTASNSHFEFGSRRFLDYAIVRILIPLRQIKIPECPELAACVLVLAAALVRSIQNAAGRAPCIFVEQQLARQNAAFGLAESSAASDGSNPILLDRVVGITQFQQEQPTFGDADVP